MRPTANTRAKEDEDEVEGREGKMNRVAKRKNYGEGGGGFAIRIISQAHPPYISIYISI